MTEESGDTTYCFGRREKERGGKRGGPGERVMEREKKERKRAIALWIDNDQIGRTGAVGQC